MKAAEALSLRSQRFPGMLMNPALTLNHEMKLPGRRGKPGGRRRITEQMMPGPAVGRTQPSGLAGLAVEAEAHLRQRRISLRLRLRPEGLPLCPSFGANST
jgi:hypothetical protein